MSFPHRRGTQPVFPFMFRSLPSLGHTGSVTPAAVVRDVAVRRGPRSVLGGATFTVPSGAVTAVIGPNGSGKSTLLYLLAGLLDAELVGQEAEGSVVEVLGAAPGSHRDRVALVLQTTEVAEHLPLTVQEAVAMGRYARRGMFALPARRDRRVNRTAVTEAMQRMEVADLANRQLDELSGGQRQRVFVAQGLAQQADMLLLDEPVTGLDMVSRQRILDVAAEEARRGVAVVMTTHDLNEAATADHVLLLSEGTVVSGPPAEVLVPDVLRRAYAGRLLVVGTDHTVVVDDPHHGHSH